MSSNETQRASLYGLERRIDAKIYKCMIPFDNRDKHKHRAAGAETDLIEAILSHIVRGYEQSSRPYPDETSKPDDVAESVEKSVTKCLGLVGGNVVMCGLTRELKRGMKIEDAKTVFDELEKDLRDIVKPKAHWRAGGFLLTGQAIRFYHFRVSKESVEIEAVEDGKIFNLWDHYRKVQSIIEELTGQEQVVVIKKQSRVARFRKLLDT